MEKIDLTAPKSWQELTQPQLDFLLRAISKVNRINNGRPFYSQDDFAASTWAQVATLCLMRWNGLELVTPYGDNWMLRQGQSEFIVTAADMAAACQAMAWAKELPAAPVRLDSVDGAQAVDAELDDGFTFDSWLACESLWQVYQQSLDAECLRRMAELLYAKEGIALRDHESLSVFYWWAGLKNLCNARYPNFFQPAPQGSGAEPPGPDKLRRDIDSQIRALTKGDITKEKEVLAMPAHRALTELDALAREYEELNRKYPTK